jgi:hypothetical protein
MEAVSTSERSVSFCEAIWISIPDDGHLQVETPFLADFIFHHRVVMILGKHVDDIHHFCNTTNFNVGIFITLAQNELV